MLRNWINLLPLFIVKRLARSKGEVVIVGTSLYHCATDGVLVRANIAAQKEGGR